MSSKWQCRRPQPPASQKDQQLDSCPRTKTALGEFWSEISNRQQQSKTKDLRKRAQEEKEESFMLPAPSRPSNWNFSEPRRNFPSRKSCPHQDRKRRVKEQLPQLLGYPKSGYWSIQEVGVIRIQSATSPAGFDIEETNGQSPADSTNFRFPGAAWVPASSLHVQHH